MRKVRDDFERPAGRGDARILVVEPFDGIRALLETALRQHGYEVEAVQAGSAAIEALDAEVFDKVVVGSPVAVDPGPDGSLLLDVLVQRRRELGFCLIVVTTHVENLQVLSAALRAEACAVLAKPFDPQQLLAEIAGCPADAHTPTRWSGIPETAIAAASR